MKVTFLNMQKITQNLSVHKQYKAVVEDAAIKDYGRVNPKQTPTAFYAAPLQREGNYVNGAQKHCAFLERCKQKLDIMAHSQVMFFQSLSVQYKV